MQLPILYSFRRCPYAIRGRMALAQADIQWEHREVSLRDKPGAMLQASSKGTVPVLVLPDGKVIDESRDVALWALEQNDPAGWLDVDREALLDLIHDNDVVFKPDLDKYKYHVRHPEQDQADYRARGERYLQKLEGMLNKHDGVGLLAPCPTLADVAVFPFIRQFAGVDRDWFDGTSYTHLVAWLKRWESSDAFRRVMDKQPLWQPID